MDKNYRTEAQSLLRDQAERIFSSVTAIEQGLERDHLRAEFDLTHPQLMTLITIARYKKCTMSELGRLTGYPTSALTGIIDRMICKKLVTRIRDKKDRRIVHVSLTMPGVDLANKLHKRMLIHTGRVLEMIGVSDREKLVRLVEKIAGAFSKKNEE